MLDMYALKATKRLQMFNYILGMRSNISSLIPSPLWEPETPYDTFLKSRIFLSSYRR